MSDLVIDGAEMNLRWFDASERNYILATWLRSFNDRMPKGKSAFDLARPLVEHVVDSHQVLVLCDREKPSVICGWIATIHGRPVWMYVLHALRGKGAGRYLLKAAQEVAEGTGAWLS